MRINVKVKTRAKKDEIEEINGVYYVHVKAVPVQGDANHAVIKLLSKYFKVPQTSIHIVLGSKNKNKVIDIIS